MDGTGAVSTRTTQLSGPLGIGGYGPLTFVMEDYTAADGSENDQVVSVNGSIQNIYQGINGGRDVANFGSSSYFDSSISFATSNGDGTLLRMVTDADPDEVGDCEGCGSLHPWGEDKLLTSTDDGRVLRYEWRPDSSTWEEYVVINLEGEVFRGITPLKPNLWGVMTRDCRFYGFNPDDDNATSATTLFDVRDSYDSNIAGCWGVSSVKPCDADSDGSMGPMCGGPDGEI